ncbi:cyclophilin-like fold protein [Flavobacterium gelatinilyticum]|uniref:cyclophilin-like fold protein n=1 Tax=Flavobacterium gelatinilyticum TaxID=3003260 RepID=UPI0024804A73|nr:cyclophilin-like fold protein [Flavobacterium gelatinilyticum]
MKLRIKVGDKLAEAVLHDNPTSQDFVALLPLTLTLRDYNNTEKVSDLSKRLTIQSAPNGYAASVGDLTYYAPWGNLALFYKNFTYATGLISLGKITSGMEAFNTKDAVIVKIELE